jgi:hypothetical protein
MRIGLMTVVEVLGWAGRTWSSHCPYNENAFLMQITTLVAAPTFLSAGAYLILGRLIRLVGRRSSLISPRTYLILFTTCDIISLVVQAVGGAKASVAQRQDKDTRPGTDIMVAGILFQLGTMSIFVIFLLDFLRRTRQEQLSRESRIVLAAMGLSVTAIFVRSIYRSVELLQGWRGFLITHQGYFIALDGAMIVIAVGVYNFVDPARLLPMNAKATESHGAEEKGHTRLRTEGYF